MKFRTDFVTNSSSSSFVTVAIDMLDGSSLTLKQDLGLDANLNELDVLLTSVSTGEDLAKSLEKGVHVEGCFDVWVNDKTPCDKQGRWVTAENELYQGYMAMVAQIPSIDLVREIRVRAEHEHDGEGINRHTAKIDYDVIRNANKAIFAISGPEQRLDEPALLSSCKDSAKSCPALKWEGNGSRRIVVEPIEEDGIEAVLRAVDDAISPCDGLEFSGMAGFWSIRENERKVWWEVGKYAVLTRYDFWSVAGVAGMAWRKRVTSGGVDTLTYGLSDAFVADIESKISDNFGSSLLEVKTKGRRVRKGVELAEGDVVLLKNDVNSGLREYSDGEPTGINPLKVSARSLDKKALGELDVDPVTEKLISLNIDNCIAFVASVEPLELLVDILPDKGAMRAEDVAEMLFRGAKKNPHESSSRYKTLKGYLRKFPERKDAIFCHAKS